MAEQEWYPAPRPGVVWHPVDDDVVAVDERGSAYAVTSTGALLWPLLDGTLPLDDAAADVADVFGLDDDSARREVEAFVERMVELGLFAASRPPEAPGAAAPVEDRLLPPRPPRHGFPVDPAWVGAMALAVGGHTVGLRADDQRLFESLGERYAPWSIEVPEVPEHFGISVCRRPGAGPRLVPELLHGQTPLLRSRSIPRLLRRLDQELGSLDGPPFLRMPHFVAIASDRRKSVLVSSAFVQRSSTIERTASAAGLHLAEPGTFELDPRASEIVVRPGLAGGIDDDLAAPAGRYRVAAVGWTATELAVDERRSTSVVRLVAGCAWPGPEERSALLEGLVEITRHRLPEPLADWGADLAPISSTLH